MRFLVDDTYFNKDTGCILFYAGNEGDIYTFYDNSGFITKDLAISMNAMIIFGEHRYYGNSMPFVDKATSYLNKNLIWLTVEQTMMDFNLLIQGIRWQIA